MCTQRTLLACALIVVFGTAGVAIANDSALYDVTIETSMPHLEENLRYTTTKVRRCFSREQLAKAFSALEEDALKTCRLELESASADSAMYRLACKDSSGTTGRATWSFEQYRSFGRLEVKLGGKNMTFFQRVTAKHLGTCN